MRVTTDAPDGERALKPLNEALLDRLQCGGGRGGVFVSNAVIDGRYALRACIVNFHTTLTDVAAVPEIVARTGGEVSREMARR